MISKVAPVTLKTPVHKLKEMSSIHHPSEISDVRQLNVNATIEATYPDQSQLTVKLLSCTGKVGKSKLGKYQNEWNVCKTDGVILDPGFTREGSYVITHVRGPSVVRPSLNISETALRIFLIFCMKLVHHKGTKVTEPDF